MKRKVGQFSIFLVLLLVFLDSCDMFTKTDNKETVSEAPERKKEEPTTNRLTSNLTSFKLASKLCKQKSGQCAEVAVQYPFFKNEGSKLVNNAIQTRVKIFLYGVLSDEKAQNISIKKIAQLIIDDYDDFISEFKNEKEQWNITLEVNNTYQNDNLIAFSLKMDTYTGGAHPNQTVSNFILDLDNNKAIKLSDLITNTSKFKKATEKIFRKQNSLSTNQNLEEEGYFFEKGKFKLNNNIGLTQNGITVYYNSYEIAPYAKGPTNITVPFYEIKDILKIKL